MGYSKQFIDRERDTLVFENIIYKKLGYEIVKEIKKKHDGIQNKFPKEKTGS